MAAFCFVFLPINLITSTDLAQSVKLRDAIKEYEANKWKVIGQKVGKPAKVSPRMMRRAFLFSRMTR